MGIVDRLRRKKAVDPDEWRRQLRASGRITDGLILDSYVNASGQEVVVYLYTLNGVDFESSDVLSPEQLAEPIKYAPGAHVGIRYDPKNQGNSVVE
jgi:hypothetical protein